MISTWIWVQIIFQEFRWHMEEWCRNWIWFDNFSVNFVGTWMSGILSTDAWRGGFDKWNSWLFLYKNKRENIYIQKNNIFKQIEEINRKLDVNTCEYKLIKIK